MKKNKEVIRSTSKEFLRQYRDVDVQIKLNNEIMSRSGSQTGFTSGKAQRWESDYLDRLYSETEDLCRLKHLIENTIDKDPLCDARERRVLQERYILNKKWEEISLSMRYSLQHVHRLHKSALSKLIVPKQYR